MSEGYNDRERESYLSRDGTRIITVERWLDRQIDPPRWRSKNWHRKLSSTDVEYFRQYPSAADKFRRSGEQRIA